MFLDRTVKYHKIEVKIIRKLQIRYFLIIDFSLEKKSMRLNATAEIRAYIAPAEMDRLLENKGEMLKLQQLF